MANLRELDRGRAPQTCLASRGVPAAWPRRLREQNRHTRPQAISWPTRRNA